MVVSNVIGLFSLRRLVGGSSVTTMLLVGVAVLAGVLIVLAARRTVGILALLLVFGAVSWDVQQRFFEAGWAQRSREATLVDVIHRLDREGVPTNCIRVSVAAQWWHVNNYRLLLPNSRFERARTVSARECGPLLIADRAPEHQPEDGQVVALEHVAGLALSVSRDALDPEVGDRLDALGLVVPGAVCDPLPTEAYRALLRIAEGDGTAPHAGGEVHIEVTHGGRGAPWIVGAPVMGAECGRVVLATEYLDRDGTVLRMDVSELPRTVFPGDSVSTAVRVADQPGTVALRFALVHDGVAWFRDRGSQDLVLPVWSAK